MVGTPRAVSAWCAQVLLCVLCVGCLRDPEPGDGQDAAMCVGGVIEDGGRCVARCNPEYCVQDNVCVDNECRLLCGDAGGCLPEQDCVSTEDDSGAAVMVCLGPIIPPDASMVPGE